MIPPTVRPSHFAMGFDTPSRYAVRLDLMPNDSTTSLTSFAPSYSRLESRGCLDSLDLRSGFEPEGRGFAPWARSVRARRAAKPHEQPLPACPFQRSSFLKRMR